MQHKTISFEIPDWISSYMDTYEVSAEVTSRMAFVIGAARDNVLRKTGGPFAAAIFESETGRLVSLGVNLVTAQGLSVLHAEVVAMMLAQRALETYDLSKVPHQLVTSAEPCAMCFGAIPWSGVTSVVAGATDADVRKIGFDEGPKHQDWKAELEQRGITVQEGVLRETAAAVFQLYASMSGVIYNSRSGD